MNPPQPRRSAWILRHALELAADGRLTARTLAERAVFTESSARRVIAVLVAEGAIEDLGPEDEKTGGRRRRRYGLADQQTRRLLPHDDEQEDP